MVQPAVIADEFVPVVLKPKPLAPRAAQPAAVYSADMSSARNAEFQRRYY